MQINAVCASDKVQMALVDILNISHTTTVGILFTVYTIKITLNVNHSKRTFLD